MRSRARFVGALILISLAAYYAGTRLMVRSAPPVHPLTGRQIAGIATDSDWMDRPERQEEEQPDRALDLVGIAPGMTVADVGAGSGYMTTRLALRVGPTGKVYANDLQAPLLQIVREKASRQGLSNIELALGTETDARLPEGAIDLALLVDVYHEFSHPQEMLQSIRRALKPDGRLALIEYRKEDPRVPIAAAHRMSVTEARREVQAEGFTFEELITGLPRQHLIVFRK